MPLARFPLKTFFPVVWDFLSSIANLHEYINVNCLSPSGSERDRDFSLIFYMFVVVGREVYIYFHYILKPGNRVFFIQC